MLNEDEDLIKLKNREKTLKSLIDLLNEEIDLELEPNIYQDLTNILSLCKKIKEINSNKLLKMEEYDTLIKLTNIIPKYVDNAIIESIKIQKNNKIKYKKLSDIINLLEICQSKIIQVKKLLEIKDLEIDENIELNVQVETLDECNLNESILNETNSNDLEDFNISI